MDNKDKQDVKVIKEQALKPVLFDLVVFALTHLSVIPVNIPLCS